MQTPFVDEYIILNQADQSLVDALAPFALANRYVNTINRLKVRANISAANVRVVSDLACSPVNVGGGVTADANVFLDGKLLDMAADVANGLAMRESGRLQLTTAQIVDFSATQQLSFANFCRPSDPLAFPDANLSQAEGQRSVEIFTQLVGGILFHEYGHVWGWHYLLGVRDRLLNPGGGFYTFTSANEDQADFIAGVLSAKSGHQLSYPQFEMDLMAFTATYRANPGYVTFLGTLGWQQQFQRTSPQYSSLAVRKQTIERGYLAWR